MIFANLKMRMFLHVPWPKIWQCPWGVGDCRVERINESIHTNVKSAPIYLRSGNFHAFGGPDQWNRRGTKGLRPSDAQSLHFLGLDVKSPGQVAQTAERFPQTWSSLPSFIDLEDLCREHS